MTKSVLYAVTISLGIASCQAATAQSWAVVLAATHGTLKHQVDVTAAVVKSHPLSDADQMEIREVMRQRLNGTSAADRAYRHEFKKALDGESDQVPYRAFHQFIEQSGLSAPGTYPSATLIKWVFLTSRTVPPKELRVIHDLIRDIGGRKGYDHRLDEVAFDDHREPYFDFYDQIAATVHGLSEPVSRAKVKATARTLFDNLSLLRVDVDREVELDIRRAFEAILLKNFDCVTPLTK